MFDTQLAAVAAARTPGDGVRACARLENAACAARLGHMADMLAAAHAADGSADREQWCFDNWAAVCAQIGAAHDITSGVANGLLTDALVLRERLPKVAEVFAAGVIGYRLVHQICARTALVKDPDALTVLDGALAELVASSGALSKDQAERTIDAMVLMVDPFAVARSQAKSRGHHADVRVDDASGTAQVEASVSVADGKALDQRVDALARTVCERDPRTLDERRAAALGAMGFGWDRLPCLCETPSCEAENKPAVGGIVVYMIAHQDAIDGAARGDGDGGPSDGGPDGPDDGNTDPAPDKLADEPAADATADAVDGPDGDGDGGVEGAADGDGEGMPDEPVDLNAAAADVESDCAAIESETSTGDSEPERPPEHEPTPAPTPVAPPVGDLTAQRRGLHGPAPALLPQPWYTYTWSALNAALTTERGELCPARPGVLLGGAVVPAPVVALAAMHATIRTLSHPGQAPPEPRYRPSKALAEFVRCRDQTCRFPGCTKPATITDVDHTVPYPWGPTAASNLACLCREHHLMKTFWPGWSNQQYPDGTIVWTDPDGNTITTHPGSRLLFPELCKPTAEIVTRGSPPAKPTDAPTVPRRKTTRDQNRHQRIDDQRRHNIPLVAQRLSECLPPY